jgi:hypothetical protein
MFVLHKYIFIYIMLSSLTYTFSMNSTLAFHIESGLTDTEGNEDFRNDIASCSSVLSSGDLAQDTDLATCDITMAGISTLCEDASHSEAILACRDPQLQAYLSDRGLLDVRFDLKEFLNLFEESRISPQ